MGDLPQNISPTKSWREDLKKKVEILSQECSQKNWDGYDANPVTPVSVACAVRFIDLLPESSSIPEIYVDPGGEFSFDWLEVRGGSFSISVSATHLNYAGIFGKEHLHDSAEFKDEIPRPILELIKRF